MFEINDYCSKIKIPTFSAKKTSTTRITACATASIKHYFYFDIVTENGQMLKVPVQLAIFIPGETIFNSSLNASELFFIARNVGKFGGIIQECLVVSCVRCSCSLLALHNFLSLFHLHHKDFKNFC